MTAMNIASERKDAALIFIKIITYKKYKRNTTHKKKYTKKKN